MLILLLLDYLGTFAFAISGALKAARKGMDLFGLAVLAIVTAIGGGTLRDVLLSERPFWLTDANYLYLALLATLAVAALYRLVSRYETLLLWFDAVGLGTFTVIGASRAMEGGVGLIGTVFFACLTTIGGGMLRDVLAGDVPVVLKREVYALAAVLGALLYWFLRLGGVPDSVTAPVVMVLVTVLRLLAMHYKLGVPTLLGRGQPAD
jgi:uncharacterized membrane protein YeiH